MLHLDTFGAKYVPLWNSFCGGPYHTVIIAWFPWRACQLSHELQNRTPAMTARTGCYSSVFPQYLVQCLTQNIYNVVFTDEWITASLIGVACLHSPRSTLLQRFMASHKPYLLLSTYLQNEGNAPIVSWHESFQLTRLRQIHLPNTRCGWTALAAVIIGLLGAVVGMRDVKTERETQTSKEAKPILWCLFSSFSPRHCARYFRQRHKKMWPMSRRHTQVNARGRKLGGHERCQEWG